MKRLRKVLNKKGFTLVEMLIVLFIISVLILLFVPTLSAQKKNVTKNGNEAIIKVVETQMELYAMDNELNELPSAGLLKSKEYITDEQYEKYIKLKPE